MRDREVTNSQRLPTILESLKREARFVVIDVDR